MGHEPTVNADAPAAIRAAVIAKLQKIFDPEIPASIYELGLVYDLQISPAGQVDIRMTLTTPACPVAQAMPAKVRERVGEAEGVTGVNVELVWEPPWEKERMSEAAKLTLGIM